MHNFKLLCYVNILYSEVIERDIYGKHEFAGK